MIGSGLQQATPSPTATSGPIQPGKARRPGAGLASPQSTGGLGGVSSSYGNSGGGTNMTVGGVMGAQSLSSVLKEQDSAADRAAADAEQQQPGITGLAGHVKSFWVQAVLAKHDVEQKMLEALYARRGEYTSAKATLIEQSGQPLIFMMLSASKMRQAEALLRDVLIGAGTEKPWCIDPDPAPELPPSIVAAIHQGLSDELQQAILAGLNPSIEQVRERMLAVKEETSNRMKEQARAQAELMEDEMETQLDEGGFNEAFTQFITDLTTFKTAFLAGPIVRKKPKLMWLPNSQVPLVQTTEVLEWERVDPFDMYPAPWARTIDDAPLIRRHRLTREALNEMIGVDGFSDSSIRACLDLYGIGGLRDWLTIDTQVARAEGKLTIGASTVTGLIDALQYWGSVSGQMLRDWGMDAKAVPDTTKEYQVEAWLIGNFVIKAVLNPDPLGRRPYYANSYERIPGSIWGNSLYDLMSDCQDMCNAAARSLAANMGIASGPQVVVNVQRLPPGENISQMYPWKIWQVNEDPMGNGGGKPIEFFSPDTNAAELMGVYEKFAALADEYTGIPRYMAGQEGTPGAGRTASGLSMMIGNASKIIKQVVASVDDFVLEPLLCRLYYWNMVYGDDPDLKGAVNIRARGALSLQTKETAQVRRSEFLQATNNPTDMAIIGLPGRAEVLRQVAKTLDMNPDKVVPSPEVIQQQAQAQQMAAQQQGQPPGGPGGPGGPPQSGGPPPVGGGTPPRPAGNGRGPGPSKPGQVLTNGAPVTDNFSPPQP